MTQLKLVKFRIKLMFSYSKVEILKVTVNESDSTINIRWRLRGVNRTDTLFQAMKFKNWSMRNIIRVNEE